MKFRFFLILSSSIYLSSCATPPVDQNTQKVINTTSIETVKLPDGSTISGNKIIFSNGDYYVGETRNGKPEGYGLIYSESGKYFSVGTFKLQPDRNEFLNDGLYKIYNSLNGIISFSIWDNGTFLKSYGELDIPLSKGDYEEAYKLRGNRAYIGVNLKSTDTENDIEIVNVTRNSPGDIAGLKQGDKLLAINEIKTSGMKLPDVLGINISLPFDQQSTFHISRNNKMLDITMTPGIIPKGYPGAENTAALLWKKVKAADTTSQYHDYLSNITDTTYKKTAQSRYNQLLAKEKEILASQKKQGIPGIIKFCQQFPNSFLLGNELPGIFANLKTGQPFILEYNSLLDQCPVSSKYQPAYYELLAIGPENMKIRDVLTLTNQNSGIEAIATKIKFSNAEYKDFSNEEMSHLYRFGLDDKIISAMLESTYKQQQNKKKIDEYQQRISQLEAENNKLKSTVNLQQTATSATTNTESNMPAECLKLIASLKACGKTSGLLSFGCESVARSSFDCPLPVDKFLN